MSISGSTLSRSLTSVADLPNLPGIRRSPPRIIQKAREQLRTSYSGTKGSALEDNDDESLGYSMGDYSRLLDMSKSLSAFPSTASSYNDISGRYSIRSQQQDRLNHSRSLPYCSLDNAPPHVVHSSEKILVFIAYFTETIPENLSENIRSRKVEIIYYMEDGTIEIFEPHENNSGLVQGKLLRRHQVAKPRPKSRREVFFQRINAPSEIYSLSDFSIGVTLDIYNRLYTIIDADSVTRQFFDEIGCPLGEKIQMPSTYYDPSASLAKSRMRRGKWDNRDELFGEEIDVRLHYILADDTIEVLPNYVRNCGRDKVKLLLRRTKVTKVGNDDDNLSLSGQSLAMSSISLSTSQVGIGQVQPKTSAVCLHWSDLKIGELVPIAAMKILLLDADEFTRQFYSDRNCPLAPPLELPKPEIKKFEIVIPPHNGFGSEIDSLTSCKGSLISSAPHKDGAKLKAFQGMILRYLARLTSTEPAAKTRKFIIQYFLEDDTLRILEPPQRNSGHKGGIFLNRSKLETRDGSVPVKAHELFIGATVTIFHHEFVLTDADEYTLRYMEENSRLWVNSDMNLIREILMTKEEILTRLILTTPGLAKKQIQFEDVEELFEKAKMNLVQQQILTLFRLLDPKRNGSIKMTKVLKFLMNLTQKK